MTMISLIHFFLIQNFFLWCKVHTWTKKKRNFRDSVCIRIIFAAFKFYHIKLAYAHLSVNQSHFWWIWFSWTVSLLGNIEVPHSFHCSDPGTIFLQTWTPLMSQRFNNSSFITLFLTITNAWTLQELGVGVMLPYIERTSYIVWR